MTGTRAHGVIDRSGWSEVGQHPALAVGCARTNGLGAKKKPGRKRHGASAPHADPPSPRALALARRSTAGARKPTSTRARPVTRMMSLAPGTGMDTAVRLYGEKLAQRLGQPVGHRAGGAGVVAGETMAKDGYTLAVATSAAVATQQPARAAAGLRPAHRLRADLAQRKSPFVFVVNPSATVPLRSRVVPVSLPRHRRGAALTAELLKQKFGFDITHVPYENMRSRSQTSPRGRIGAAGASLPSRRRSCARLPSLATRRAPPIAGRPGYLAHPELEAVSWHVIFARHDTRGHVSSCTAWWSAPDMQRRCGSASSRTTPRRPKGSSATSRQRRKSVVRELGLEGSAARQGPRQNGRPCPLRAGRSLLSRRVDGV